jgi:hypothetical protein
MSLAASTEVNRCAATWPTALRAAPPARHPGFSNNGTAGGNSG